MKCKRCGNTIDEYHDKRVEDNRNGNIYCVPCGKILYEEWEKNK